MNSDSAITKETGISLSSALPGIPFRPFAGASEGNGSNSGRPGQGEKLCCSLYPKPLLSHEDVLASEEIFLKNLEELHTELYGNPLRVPQLGNKPINLHALYTKVTAEDGYLKVCQKYAWKNVSVAFQAATSELSTPYMLRKVYERLLWHFEQVYLHGAGGKAIGGETSLPMGRQMALPEAVEVSDHKPVPVPVAEVDAPKPRAKRRKKSMLVDPEQHLGSSVKGVIHKKFEFGYFVSVSIGSEKLEGILYPAPPVSTGVQSPCRSGAEVAASGGMVASRAVLNEAAPETDRAAMARGGAARETTPLPLSRELGTATGGGEVGGAHPWSTLESAGEPGFRRFFEHWKRVVLEQCPHWAETLVHACIDQRWRVSTAEEKKPYEVEEATGEEDAQRQQGGNI